MAISAAQKKAVAKYNAANYDRVELRLDKGLKDTVKAHAAQQGETLNTLSEIAYDDPTLWRSIATANGITNPRLLRTGDVLHMPAITD